MRLSARLALAAWLMPLAGLAQAQGDPASDPLRERTGPGAAPQPLPDFPAPSVFPAPVPPSSATTAAGTVAFANVSVRATSGTAAVPRRGWAPAPDPVTGLRLEHRRGERLDAQWVERQFVANGLIGAPVELDRIVALVQQINLAFVANGYINSGVLIAGPAPAQGGVLELVLVSGGLVAPSPGAPPVTISWGAGGARGLSAGFVRERMPSAAGVPLNARHLERDFRLLAEHPAIRTVNADLRPGARPGEATLALVVDPQPRFDYYLTAANSRAPSIGGERLAAGGSIRNLVRGGDLVSAEGGVTSGRGDIVVGYEMPFLDPRTSLTLRGGYNEAAVVDRPLLPLDIEASDLTFEGGAARRVLQRPLTPGERPGEWRPAQSLTLGLRLAHRRSITTLLGRRFSFSPGSVDGRAEYSALRLTGDWVRRGVDQVFAVALTATQGFGATRSDVPGLLSPETDFRVLLGQASYARRLDGRGLELRARLSGQVADSVLYSGERFAAGGEYSVRGYRETLVLADRGANGSVELARPFSLTGGRRDARGVDWGAFLITAFADGAVLRNAEGPRPVPDELASVGLSLAWVPSDAIFARITFAESLIDAPIVGTRDLQDRGVQFRVTIRPFRLLR